MACLVTIDCFENLKKIYIVFTGEDFAEVDRTWHDTESFMPSIRHLRTFSDCECWADLSFNHWKMLIGNKASDVAGLSTQEQNDLNNVKVKILHFFLKGLIYKLENEVGGDVDFVRVQLINSQSMAIHWNMTDNVAISEDKPSRPALRLLDGNK